jgi:ribosomal protein S18 acetylase RimI-like enzyme
VEIRKILKEDLHEVVDVHKNSFKGFFLTELGDNFLTIYYDCVRKDERGVLIGLFDEGQLFGFCAATTVSKGFNTHIVKKNIFRFSIVGILLLLTRIPSLIRLFKNFSKTNSSVKDEEEYAELLSIGVSDKKQGQGIGKKLLIQLEHELRIKGCSNLSLTTDYNDNEKAVQFYKGLGYTVYYHFVSYPNRKMYRMIKKLTEKNENRFRTTIHR